jgi:hypothetical protein
LVHTVINMVKFAEPTRLPMRLFGQENFAAAPVRDIGGAPVTR